MNASTEVARVLAAVHVARCYAAVHAPGPVAMWRSFLSSLDHALDEVGL